MKSKTDWARVNTLTDDDIAKAVAADPDAAPLEAKGLRLVSKGGRPRQATTKQVTTIRLPNNVIDFFKAGAKNGKGWQTRLSTVLEAYVKEHKAS